MRERRGRERGKERQRDYIPSYNAVTESELNTGAGLAKIIENENPATLWKLSSASVTCKFHNTAHYTFGKKLNFH